MPRLEIQRLAQRLDLQVVGGKGCGLVPTILLEHRAHPRAPARIGITLEHPIKCQRQRGVIGLPGDALLHGWQPEGPAPPGVIAGNYQGLIAGNYQGLIAGNYQGLSHALKALIPKNKNGSCDIYHFFLHLNLFCRDTPGGIFRNVRRGGGEHYMGGSSDG